MNWTFELNDQPMSAFKQGAVSFQAFSGLKPHVNRRMSACLVGVGPIPVGQYYILDRESGGRLGWLRDMFNERSSWFALYADDGSVDDETFCDAVKRGQFRLHPKGPLGVSQGCIVIDKRADFQRASVMLKSSSRVEVPRLGAKAYGKVVVT